MAEAGAIVIVYRRNFGADGTGTTVVPVPYYQHADGSLSPIVHVPELANVLADSGDQVDYANASLGMLTTMQDVVEALSASATSILQSLSAMPGSRGKHAASTSLPVTLATDEDLAVHPAQGATFPVSITGQAGNIAIAGTVAVSNLPGTQQVAGSVGVTNFPASFSVSNFPATQPISGSVSVSNFPATQAVSGSLSISGATNSYRFTSAANTTAQQIKAGAGKLFDFLMLNSINPGLLGTTLALFGATRYVKFYDKATAPTASDTPILTVPVAAGGMTPWTSSAGRPFTNGLWIRITQGFADSDNTAPAAGDVVVQAMYS